MSQLFISRMPKMRAAIFPRGSLTLEVNKMQLKVASYGIKRTN